MAKLAAVVAALSPQLGRSFQAAPYVAAAPEATSKTGQQLTSISPLEGPASDASTASSAATLGALGVLASAGVVAKGLGDARTMKKSKRAQGLVSVAAFESELGVQAPFGYWDPLGLSKDGDAEIFARRRVTEIKHGRVSMFACLGYIVPEYVKWPGYCSPSSGLQFSDIPNGLGALSKVPGAGWVQMFLFAGLIEKGLFVYDPSRAPGDYENGGVLGVPNGSTLPAGEAKTRKLNAEIANGRLAMMAIIGMFYQDGLTGSAWGDWSLYTDSPLRAEPVSAAVAAAAAAKAAGAAGAAKAATGTALSMKTAGEGKKLADYKPFGEGPFDPTKQVGALPPLNFWDPAGLCKDEASFRKYRTAEIKHARVAMMASIGLVAGHYNKFEWIQPTTKTGVAAFQDPGAAAGFGILFLIAGFYELVLWKEDDAKAPGDFGDPAGWAETFPNLKFNDEVRNRELNNGRFAMFAVIGILVAEQQTGLDAVQQLDAAGARWSEMGGFENF